MMKALSHYRKDKWVLMYVDHWIKDDIMKEGNLKARSRGTPHGGVISPLLSNLFLHVVFDGWMQNKIRKSLLNATRRHHGILQNGATGVVHACAYRGMHVGLRAVTSP